MRVAMYYNNSDIRVEEVPIPKIGSGEILIKVMASGICGSDVMEWYRVKRAPLVLGHEIAGEIAEVGKGLEGFKVGDRVSASHHVPCNECHYCLNDDHTMCDLISETKFDPGGFTEYLRLPKINIEKGGIYPIPEDVSFEEATFTEPLACVLRGQRRAGLEEGQSVLVLGSGISGTIHINLARVKGASPIIATDVSDFRLSSAKKFGANETINAKEDVPSKVRDLNDGKLVDIVILCTSATPAITQALQSVERGGTVLFFAPADAGVTLPVPINEIFWRRDVTLTTSYAGSPMDHLEALKWISSSNLNLKDMITHRLSLAETSKGFQLVAKGDESLKVIIEPQR